MDDQIQKDGLNAHTVLDANDYRFDITEPLVVPSTISVTLNGDTLASGYWDYDEEIGKVVMNIVTGFDLEVDDLIEIRYHYYKKYSDEAIEAYIEASFPYFVTYQYPKTFEICDGEIVATNNIEPTLEEKYLIALVTSIIIEPSQLNITTPDFSFRSASAGDKRTLDEKIGSIFRHANKAKGIIEFLDTDC